MTHYVKATLLGHQQALTRILGVIIMLAILVAFGMYSAYKRTQQIHFLQDEVLNCNIARDTCLGRLKGCPVMYWD